jgi:hypothetical protein
MLDFTDMAADTSRLRFGVPTASTGRGSGRKVFMAEPHGHLASDVHALVADLLPVLAPQAQLDLERQVVIIPVSASERARVSTDSLLRACTGRPQHTWPQLVESWLREVTDQAAQAATATPDDLRDRLRLRIVPRLDQQLAASLVVLPYGKYFDAMLVADHPDRVESLTKEHAARLGPEQEIRQIAMVNTVNRELKTLDIRDHQVTATESVRVLAKDRSPYVSSALLAVQRFLSGPVQYGAFVSVPRFSMVLVYEVASEAALDFAVAFAEMTNSMNAGIPDPFGPEIYWWLEGDFFPLHIEKSTEGERRQVHLPDELRRTVQNLPRANP